MNCHKINPIVYIHNLSKYTFTPEMSANITVWKTFPELDNCIIIIESLPQDTIVENKIKSFSNCILMTIPDGQDYKRLNIQLMYLDPLTTTIKDVLINTAINIIKERIKTNSENTENTENIENTVEMIEWRITKRNDDFTFRTRNFEKYISKYKSDQNLQTIIENYYGLIVEYLKDINKSGSYITKSSNTYTVWNCIVSNDSITRTRMFMIQEFYLFDRISNNMSDQQERQFANFKQSCSVLDESFNPTDILYEIVRFYNAKYLVNLDDLRHFDQEGYFVVHDKKQCRLLFVEDTSIHLIFVANL